MADSGELSYWRGLFRGSGADVLEVIERAIDVAATDRPGELLARRDRIAERLFTLSAAAAVSGIEEEEKGDGSVRGSASAAEKESKGSSRDVDELNIMASNYSYDEAEALTVEIDEESMVVAEVIGIRDILYNMNEESESVLFQSLRRLQLMCLSVETLKVTEIGRAVNGLRKHKSIQIRHLVRALIEGWKVLVDKWVSTTNAVTDNSPESINPSSTIDDEVGLPSLPLDEGAFLAAHTTTMQLSGFFDGMDDDGNPSEMDRSVENPRPYGDHKPEDKQHFTCPNARVQNTQQIKSRDTSIKQPEPLVTYGSGGSSKPITDPRRPSREISEPKPSSVTKLNHQKTPAPLQRQHTVMPVSDKSKASDDTSVRAKLEVAKRKLQERYQEAENAKKQRTIQVMELQDIPKKSNNFRQANLKPKNHSRNWAHAMR